MPPEDWKKLMVSLGVPEAVFRGEPCSGPSPLLKIFETLERRRIARNLRAFKKSYHRQLQKLVPLVWEPIYRCSPRGSLLVRRPARIEWSDLCVSSSAAPEPSGTTSCSNGNSPP